MKKIILFTFLFACAVTAFAQSLPVDTSKYNAQKKNISIFLTAVNIAGLDVFSDNKPYTIFAPDNKAFEKLAPGMLDSLLKSSNRKALLKLLNNHIIPGIYTIRDIEKQLKLYHGEVTFTTLSGIKVIGALNANRNLVLLDDDGKQSIVKVFDMQKGNVIVFIVNAVIDPSQQ